MSAVSSTTLSDGTEQVVIHGRAFRLLSCAQIPLLWLWLAISEKRYLNTIGWDNV